MTLPTLRKEHHRDVCLQKILSSNLLLEEDYEVITLLQAESLPHSEKPQDRRVLPFSTLQFVHIFVATISILLGLLNFSHVFFQGFALLAILYFFFIIISQVKQRWKKPQHHSALDEYIQCSQELQAIMKKCLRFIKEMEIAAMGYTLISGNTPANRCQKARQRFARECLQLRYQVLTSAVKITILHRNAALKITERECGNTELKFNLSLCQIPVEELGPCFDNSKNFEDLVELTDNFCLEVLRDILYFMFAQRSELLRILSLATHNEKGCDVDSVNDLSQELCLLTKEATQKVARVHKAHQNVERDIFRGNSDRSKLDNGVKTPLFTSMHSIQVHLRAALQVAIESEESLNDVKKNEDYLKDHLLPQLRIHLDASSHCIDESVKHLTFQPEASSDVPKLCTPSLLRDGKHINEPPDASLLDPKEDFTEDQIFEAVSDVLKDTAKTNEEEIANDNWVTRKKRIEETKHVMKELRSVLHVKTSAEEREMRKSKLFPNYVPKMVQSQPPLTISETELEVSATLNNDLHETEGHPLEKDLLGEGDVKRTHGILRQPQRPRPPGRTRRKSRLRNSTLVKQKSEQGGSEEESSKESLDLHRNPMPMGFGFPTALASQAAHAALLGKAVQNSGPSGFMVGMVGEETTFGDSDSQEECNALQ